ncbi:hypothetical protein J6590_003376 [Homalodisca vitripennis]|nr:hypothetical protein J6590_003376 [Homalodisca vitripennis]
MVAVICTWELSDVSYNSSGSPFIIQGRNRRNTLNQWRSPVGDGSKLQSRRSAAVQWGVGVQL